MIGDNWFMEIAEGKRELPAKPALSHLSFLTTEMEGGGAGRAEEPGSGNGALRQASVSPVVLILCPTCCVGACGRLIVIETKMFASVFLDP